MTHTVPNFPSWLRELLRPRQHYRRHLKNYGTETIHPFRLMGNGVRPFGLSLERISFVIMKSKRMLKKLPLVVFSATLCVNFLPHSLADVAEFNDYRSALESSNFNVYEDVVPDLLKLCFDPNASQEGALETCMMLWIPLSKRGAPQEDKKSSFHVLTRSCSKRGDDLSWRPCLNGSSLALSELEALSISQEFSVRKYKDGCKEEGYLGVKATMSCVRLTKEAISRGFGVAADEYRASGYYILACRTGFGRVCFIVKLDGVDAQNKWIRHAVAVDEDETIKTEMSDRELVLSDIELRRMCELEGSPDADACFWAGHAFRSKALFLRGEERKEGQLKGSQMVFERGCELGSLAACNELYRLKQ